MGKAVGFAGVNPKLSDVLHDVSVKVEDSDNKNVDIFTSPAKASISAGLQGLNPILIATIKAKEAARAKMEMTRLSQLKKLPELARIIR